MSDRPARRLRPTLAVTRSRTEQASAVGEVRRMVGYHFHEPGAAGRAAKCLGVRTPLALTTPLVDVALSDPSEADYKRSGGHVPKEFVWNNAQCPRRSLDEASRVEDTNQRLRSQILDLSRLLAARLLAVLLPGRRKRASPRCSINLHEREDDARHVWLAGVFGGDQSDAGAAGRMVELQAIAFLTFEDALAHQHRRIAGEDRLF